MTSKARPVARGCGAARTRGAVYLELGVGPGGRPIEDYLLDPPHPVDVDALGVSPLGVTLIERDGVTHVLDWVGEHHYPNVADYVEECLPPEEPVITRRGLVPIGDVNPGDEVLTHCGRWRRVVDAMRRPFHGELVRLTTYGTNEALRSTPAHPVLVGTPTAMGWSLRWVPAGEVGPGDWMAFPVERHASAPAEVQMMYEHSWPRDKRQILSDAQIDEIRSRYGRPAPRKHGKVSYRALAEEYGTNPSTIMRAVRGKKVHRRGRSVPVGPALMALMGYYLAEGSVAKTCGDGRAVHVTHLSFGHGDLERQYAEEAAAAARGLGWSARVADHQGQIRVTIGGRALAEWLARECGSGAFKKKLPEWVFALDERLIRVLLRCYLHGDGHYRDGCWEGATVSAELAVGLRRLAGIVGGIGSVYRRPNGDRVIYQVRFCHGDRAGIEAPGKLRRDGSFQFMRVRSAVREPYDGEVCNLSVDGDESYCTRYYAVHNCRRFGLSRKVAPNLPFHRLTPASRILQIHPRAYISNAQEYRPRLEEPLASRYSCPKKIEHHHTGEASFCLGVCWEDVEGGRDHPGGGERRVLREMPSFAYEALRRPEGIEPGYRPAIFASFPISRIVVIRGDADEHEPALKAARKSVLPVDLEDA